MKSSIGLCIKFLLITIVGITIPQLAFLAIVLNEPLWVFLETGTLGITVLLFLIYYIVFSIILGKKSYRYLKSVSVSIIMFIVLNFCDFLCFYFALSIYAKKLSLDPFGSLTILLIVFSLVIVSNLIFSITSIITKSNLKKDCQTGNNNI